MDYKQIEEANKKLASVDVKGKDYVEVNQRIKAFRMIEPNGSIETEILSLENGVCLMKTTVKNSDGKVLGVGHAYEKENSTFINKTSYIENCETSAVGRALGMLALGIDTSVASAEEVKNAIKNQEQPPTTKVKFSPKLMKEAEELNINLEALANYLKKSVNQLTNEDLEKSIANKRKFANKVNNNG